VSTTRLEMLVKEWYDAQKVIERMTKKERRNTREPLDRLIAAHDALINYVDKEMG
jgi:hypothetical protein